MPKVHCARISGLLSGQGLHWTERAEGWPSDAKRAPQAVSPCRRGSFGGRSAGSAAGDRVVRSDRLWNEVVALTEVAQTSGAAQASVRRSRRVSPMWLIPLIAVAIGGWLARDTLSKEGPTITLTFDNGEGLQAGQSQLKFKDIVFGTVKSVGLTADRKRVAVTVATTRQAEPLLTSTTIFWVVKPRLFAGNFEGLSTLASGSYIGMLPGESEGKPQRAFVGHEDPPVLETNIPGHTFMLQASHLGSISLGSPVFFRDLDVGTVLGWDIGDMAKTVTIHAFVRAPYDGYIHDQTRFWNASGFALNLGSGGVTVQVELLRAVLLGGIAFDTPTQDAGTVVSGEDHVFPLFDNQEAANSASVHLIDPGNFLFSRVGQRAGTRLRGDDARAQGRRGHERGIDIRPGEKGRRRACPFRGPTRARRRYRQAGVQDRGRGS